MGMTLAAGSALTVLARALDGGALVGVMMNGSVGVDVNMIVNVALDMESRDLLGDLIEAIGRNGAVRTRERNRRHDDAGKVDQRDKARDAA